MTLEPSGLQAESGVAVRRVHRASPAALTVRAYLQLVRPANVVTAAADVLAGYAVARASGVDASALPWLIAAGCALYAGGVVLNDVFDRSLDARERPERPIPSGRVPARHAAIAGFALLALGVAFASQATSAAALLAAAIAIACISYDAWSKHRGAWGPVNMGLCRGLNLLLGIAAAPAALAVFWPLGFFGFVYIAAVTVVSRGEVAGGTRRVAMGSLVAIALVMAGLAVLALFPAVPAGPSLVAALLVGLLAWRVLPAFWRAVRDPRPASIRVAVRTGVLSLVLLDAVIATAFAGPAYGALVLATALLALALARVFAVT